MKCNYLLIRVCLVFFTIPMYCLLAEDKKTITIHNDPFYELVVESLLSRQLLVVGDKHTVEVQKARKSREINSTVNKIRLSSSEDCQVAEFSELEHIISVYKIMYIHLFYWLQTRINNQARSKIAEKVFPDFYRRNAFILRKYYSYIVKDPLILSNSGSFTLPFPSLKKLSQDEQCNLLNSFLESIEPFLKDEKDLRLNGRLTGRNSEKSTSKAVFIGKDVKTITWKKSGKVEVITTIVPFDENIFSTKKNTLKISDYQLKNELLPIIKKIKFVMSNETNKEDFYKTSLILALYMKEGKQLTNLHLVHAYWVLVRNGTIGKSDFVYSELAKATKRNFCIARVNKEDIFKGSLLEFIIDDIDEFYEFFKELLK